LLAVNIIITTCNDVMWNQNQLCWKVEIRNKTGRLSFKHLTTLNGRSAASSAAATTPVGLTNFITELTQLHQVPNIIKFYFNHKVCFLGILQPINTYCIFQSTCFCTSQQQPIFGSAFQSIQISVWYDRQSTIMSCQHAHIQFWFCLSLMCKATIMSNITLSTF
jgi:hypothetical protein